MLRVGLSGGIGAGKSAAASRFADLGALVVDSDLLAREVVSPGSEGLAVVAERFGAGVLAPHGGLDRAALGAVVFADAGARRDLERITHPRIATLAQARMAAAAPGQVVVHDVPLLVEKSLGAAYHLVVLVHAEQDVRMSRLTGLRHLTDADAMSRIAAQATDEQRRTAADVWLDNNGGPADLDGEVDRLWAGRLVPFNANLLARRRVSGPDTPTLVAPDPTWPAQARRLAARIERVLGDRAASVEHIGSTSVPGLVGKDVIDLQVGVRRLSDADEPGFVDALAGKGFPRVDGNVQDQPQPDVRGPINTADPASWTKRFHGSADPGRIAHVHIRAAGGPGWVYALLFRDWLRADARERAAYAAHKQALAATSPTTTAYAAAKEPWFTQATSRAQAWARHTGWAP